MAGGSHGALEAKRTHFGRDGGAIRAVEAGRAAPGGAGQAVVVAILPRGAALALLDCGVASLVAERPRRARLGDSAPGGGGRPSLWNINGWEARFKRKER